MRRGNYIHDDEGNVIVDMLCDVCGAVIAGSGQGACGTWITITGYCKPCNVTTTGRQHLDCKHG
jgi:hypothetical protein